MKNIRPFLMLLLITVGVLFLGDASLAIDSTLQKTVGQYLNALKSGDVQSIMQILSKEQYQRREKLLKNPRYPKFLQRHYRDCEFHIGNVRYLYENQVEVDIEVFSHGKISSATTLTFKKQAEEWKLLHDKKSTSSY